MKKIFLMLPVLALLLSGCGTASSTTPVNTSVASTPVGQAITANWNTYVNVDKTVTFMYPKTSYYSGNDNCHDVPLTVLEKENGIFVVQDRIYDPGKDCTKFKKVTVADLTGPGFAGPTDFYVYAARVKDEKAAQLFVQDFFKRPDCKLTGSSPFSVDKDGKPVGNIDRLIFTVDTKDATKSMSAGCNDTSIAFNKDKGVLMITHGKLSGPILYLDQKTIVDEQIQNSVKFL